MSKGPRSSFSVLHRSTFIASSSVERHLLHDPFDFHRIILHRTPFASRSLPTPLFLCTSLLFIVHLGRVGWVSHFRAALDIFIPSCARAGGGGGGGGPRVELAFLLLPLYFFPSSSPSHHLSSSSFLFSSLLFLSFLAFVSVSRVVVIGREGILPFGTALYRRHSSPQGPSLCLSSFNEFRLSEWVAPFGPSLRVALSLLISTRRPSFWSHQGRGTGRESRFWALVVRHVGALVSSAREATVGEGNSIFAHAHIAILLCYCRLHLRAVLAFWIWDVEGGEFFCSCLVFLVPVIRLPLLLSCRSCRWSCTSHHPSPPPSIFLSCPCSCPCLSVLLSSCCLPLSLLASYLLFEHVFSGL